MQKRLHKLVMMALALIMVSLPVLSQAMPMSADDHKTCCMSQMSDEEGGSNACDNESDSQHDCTGGCLTCGSCFSSHSNTFPASYTLSHAMQDLRAPAYRIQLRGISPTPLSHPPQS
jgi:hypothetical protein